jgi:hypothetical protein
MGLCAEALQEHPMSKTQTSDSKTLSRRTVFAGAGAVGALAAAATLLPGTPDAVAADATPPAERDADGRYQLSQHVQQYYRTARV